MKTLDIAVIASVVILVTSLVTHRIAENKTLYEKVCAAKGFQLKTSAYDTKLEKVTIYCE